MLQYGPLVCMSNVISMYVCMYACLYASMHCKNAYCLHSRMKVKFVQS